MSRHFPDQLDVVDDDMARVLRQKCEAERLAIAHDMWTYARNMILHVVRGEHPEWSDAEVARETARRLSHGAA